MGMQLVIRQGLSGTNCWQASAGLHKVPMIAAHHAKHWEYKAEDKSLPFRLNGKRFAKSSDFKKQPLTDLALILTHESPG